MEEFKELKELWQSEKAENLPSSAAFNHSLQEYQRKQSYRLLAVIAGLSVCLFLMVYLVISTTIHNWQNLSGSILIIVVTLYIIYFKYNSWRRKKNQELLSSHDYIEELRKEKIHANNNFPYKHAIALFGLFIGFCLYLYPVLSKNFNRIILGYSSIILFFLFAWFIYRPFMKKQYWKKNAHYINHINNIKNQLNE